jgi:hypothetical protein
MGQEAALRRPRDTLRFLNAFRPHSQVLGEHHDRLAVPDHGYKFIAIKPFANPNDSPGWNRIGHVPITLSTFPQSVDAENPCAYVAVPSAESRTRRRSMRLTRRLPSSMRNGGCLPRGCRGSVFSRERGGRGHDSGLHRSGAWRSVETSR